MKAILLFFIVFSSVHASTQNTPKADDMKFVTKFTNYACKSFRDKVEAPDQIKALEIEITKLGVASNTRKAILDAQSLDQECAYHAEFSREKGFKILHFENSYISPESTRCLEFKDNFDEILASGFRYAIKYNNYISMLFVKELTGPCDEISGKHLIEFAWL